MFCTLLRDLIDHRLMHPHGHRRRGGRGSHPSMARHTRGADSGLVAIVADKAISPALLLGTALAIRLTFLFMPTGFDVYRYVWEGPNFVRIIQPLPPSARRPSTGRISAMRSGNPSVIQEPRRSIHRSPSGCSPPWPRSGWGPLGFKIVFTAADLALCGLLCSRLRTEIRRDLRMESTRGR